MLAIFVVLTLVITVCDQQIEIKNQTKLIDVLLLVFTITFSFYQIAVASWLSLMVWNTKSKLSIVLLGIVWLVCVATVVLVIIKNSSWESLVSKKLKRAATGLFLSVTYVAVLLIMFLLYRANKNAVLLV